MRKNKGFFKRTLNWLNQYKVIIIALIAIPIVIGGVMMIPFFDLNNGSNDGWLGFWGGYLASIITILGVYWQVKKQSEEAKQNLVDTFANEKVREMKKARPEFICERDREKLKDIEYWLNNAPGSQATDFVEWVAKDNPLFEIFKIQNLSSSAIVNARVKLIYSKGKYEYNHKLEWFIVKKILPGATFKYVPKDTQKNSLDAQNIGMVDIWFNTASGEEVQYRMIDNYSNGMFNTMAIISRLDSPNSSNLEDYPPNNIFDYIEESSHFI